MSDDQSPVFLAPDEDPEMEAASQRARETFRYFWREMTWEHRRIIPALGVAAVKGAFSDPIPAPGPSPHVEHMWVGDVNFDGATVSGRLMNSPNWLKTVKAGDAVQIPFTQLGDWMYSRGERCYGAFTVNLLRSRMDANERSQHDNAWGMDFGDPADIQLIPDWAAEKQGTQKRGLFGRKKQQEVVPSGVDLTAEHPMALNMLPAWGEQMSNDPSAVRFVDDQGWTQLHYMALGGSVAAVTLMLDRGADPTAITNHGWSAAQLAYSLGWSDVVTLLQQRGG